MRARLRQASNPPTYPHTRNHLQDTEVQSNNRGFAWWAGTGRPSSNRARAAAASLTHFGRFTAAVGEQREPSTVLDGKTPFLRPVTRSAVGWSTKAL